MNRRFHLPLALLVTAFFVIPALSAQTSGGREATGPVHVTFDSGSYVGTTLHVSGVALTSKEYDLQAATAVVDLSPNTGLGGNASVTKVVALGDPARKTQVTGRFASVEQARTYLVRGDKAVYVPEAGRVGGGRIDFTGHVILTMQAPQALAGPAVTHVEQATVRVGPGPDYPKVEFGPGILDFTPIH